MTEELFSDKEILDSVVGGYQLRHYTAVMFMSWVISKLDGMQTYRPETQELLIAARSAPSSRSMSDDAKVAIVRKLFALGVTL
jgi:hypothetical protein